PCPRFPRSPHAGFRQQNTLRSSTGGLQHQPESHNLQRRPGDYNINRAPPQHGILVYFAAWKQHIGLYPPISGDSAVEKAVARYAGPKGNLQFPLAEPMPLALIERIVKLRVKQDSEKAEAKRKKKPQPPSKPRASK
ncbi:MAG: hypothetical protein J0I06_16755, partial [Planctomycetes bacterium]|nr:hypothetical protein [Planctomycetota bacterium]